MKLNLQQHLTIVTKIAGLDKALFTQALYKTQVSYKHVPTNKQKPFTKAKFCLTAQGLSRLTHLRFLIYTDISTFVA